MKLLILLALAVALHALLRWLPAKIPAWTPRRFQGVALLALLALPVAIEPIDGKLNRALSVAERRWQIKEGGSGVVAASWGNTEACQNTAELPACIVYGQFNIKTRRITMTPKYCCWTDRFLLAVMTHEVGHSLGLDHSTNPFDLMNVSGPFYGAEYPQRPELVAMWQTTQGSSHAEGSDSAKPLATVEELTKQVAEQIKEIELLRADNAWLDKDRAIAYATYQACRGQRPSQIQQRPRIPVEKK